MSADHIAGRLRIALKDESVSAFAKRCGLSESLVRKYLNGSVPSLDRAAAMAHALGVSLAWLATGSGEMRPSGSSHAQNRQATRLDVEALIETVDMIEEWLQTNSAELPPRKKAELTARLYQLIMEEIERGAPPLDKRTTKALLRLVV